MNINLKFFEGQKGLTSVELIIVITILAVLFTLAYPVFKKMLHDMEAKRIKNIIFNTLRIAKTTSYANHRHVYMCLTDKNLNCNVNGNSYLILFYDTNSNNNFDSSIDKLIITEHLNLSYARVQLATGGRRKYIRFSKDTGTPRGFMGHIKYCTHDYDNLNKYQISFNMVGLFRYKPNAIHHTGC